MAPARVCPDLDVAVTAAPDPGEVADRRWDASVRSVVVVGAALPRADGVQVRAR